MIRRLIPRRLRLFARILMTYLADFKQGYHAQFALPNNLAFDAKPVISLTQELKPNEAKLINLRIACKAIGQIIIQPNEIFSFWKSVGAPTKRKGFVSSRSIEGNQINTTVGGGLCQISGLIYYLSLKAGLEIIERHNHSMDIYTDDTRFAPLGSDATLVYGYKDLRVKNNHGTALKFDFVFDAAYLTIKLMAKDVIQEREIVFREETLSNSKVEVKTYIQGTLIDRSIYKKLL